MKKTARKAVKTPEESTNPIIGEQVNTCAALTHGESGIFKKGRNKAEIRAAVENSVKVRKYERKNKRRGRKRKNFVQ